MEIDASLVRRLVAWKFPRWAALPLRAVRSAGTDNALFRLGGQLCVRLPLVDWAVEEVLRIALKTKEADPLRGPASEYGPGTDLLSRISTIIGPDCLTTVVGMGTGVTSQV